MYRRTEARLTLLYMIAGGSLVCALATGTDVAQESNTLVLETLLKQQAAAFDAIKTVEMEYSYRIESTAEDIPGPDGKVAISGGRQIRTGVIKFATQGENKREHHQYQTEFPGRGALMRDTWELISTPSVFFEYVESTGQVFMHHLDPQRDSDPAIAARRDSIPWKNLLDYGFYPGKGQLLQLYRLLHERNPGKYRWLVSGGGDEPYRIEVVVDEGKKSRRMREFLLNQQRGFLVTSYKSYDKQGQLDWDIDVEPHQVTPQIWVPGEVREWSLENAWTVEMSLMHVKLNETIPKTQFTIESMGFNPEETVLMEYFPNTKPVAKALYGGVWISRDQWPEELKERMHNRPRHLPAGGGYGGIWVKGNAVE